MLALIASTTLVALYAIYEHTVPNEAVVLTRDQGSDVVVNWLPAVLSGLASGFAVFRLSKLIKGEEFLPSNMQDNAFPAAFLFGLGGVVLHEFLELATSQKGGLTAWAPLLSIVLTFGCLARYAQGLANEQNPSLAPSIASIVLTGRYVMNAIITGPEEPKEAETVTASVVAAGKKAFKKGKEAVGAVPPPQPPAPDVFAEFMPHLVVLGIAVALTVRFLSGSKDVVPKSAPWCIMAAGIAACANSVYRTASANPEAHPDDFAALIAIATASACVARFGVTLQAD
eukprot:TRINITY_DN4067_c0_g1_i1.p1 TRINITY_DN4067_c0_g1~~TRINITY_DN4067_c0_g1_i1.p1  ORF type:complete len:285 (-),score=77.65 TRINITY_DN4067_c0_g1_i1:335-1189(-)